MIKLYAWESEKLMRTRQKRFWKKVRWYVFLIIVGVALGWVAKSYAQFEIEPMKEFPCN